MAMNVKEFLSYIKQAKTKATYKNYKQGIKKFVEWYGKSADTILKERFEDLQSTEQTVRRRFNREIEKFHRHLRNLGHPQNTAVAYTEGIRQLFRFYDMDVKGLPSEVTRKVVTTKDFIPTVQQYRDMFNCGALEDRTINQHGFRFRLENRRFQQNQERHIAKLGQRNTDTFRFDNRKRRSGKQIFSKLTNSSASQNILEDTSRRESLSFPKQQPQTLRFRELQ